jgi:hypothetical protein
MRHDHLCFHYPTNAPEILLACARKELDIMHAKGIPYRTAGVGLHGLAPAKALSNDLFGNVTRAAKFEEIHKTIDKLEKKYGKRVVHLASTHAALDHDEGGTEAEDLDRNLLFL